MPSLLPQTYTEKVIYLIDCVGYTHDDLDGLGELAIDDIIISNHHTADLEAFTNPIVLPSYTPETNRVYGALILDTNQWHIPAYLFYTEQERLAYLEEYNIDAYRFFEYETPHDLAVSDISEWYPRYN